MSFAFPPVISTIAPPSGDPAPPRLVIAPTPSSRWLRPRLGRNGLGLIGIMFRHGPSDAYVRSATVAYVGCELPRVWRRWTSRDPEPAQLVSLEDLTWRLRTLVRLLLARVPRPSAARLPSSSLPQPLDGENVSGQLGAGVAGFVVD